MRYELENHLLLHSHFPLFLNKILKQIWKNFKISNILNVLFFIFTKSTTARSSKIKKLNVKNNNFNYNFFLQKTHNITLHSSTTVAILNLSYAWDTYRLLHELSSSWIVLPPSDTFRNYYHFQISHNSL